MKYFSLLKTLQGILIVILVLFFTVKMSDQGEAFKGGVYTNIYGSGYVSCTNNCNNLFIGEADCKPDSGTCTGKDRDGKNSWWVLKYTCKGDKNTRECGGRGPAPIREKWHQGTLTVDAETKCGEVVQLDVFTKKCDVGGGWSCTDSDLKGYMTWYAGDCPAATNTPVPACNTSCSSDKDCQGAKDSCTVCNKTTNKCEAPSTPVPACNTNCSSDKDCQGAKDSCTVCNKTTNKCEAPPNDPGPNDPGPNDPGPNDPGPNDPGPNDPGPVDPTATPVPPTATPTPDPYNEAMCKCDGITVSQIIAGQQAVFTANGKVEGTDTQYAQIKDIEFLLSIPSTKQRIAGPQSVPATVLTQSSTSVQYQSQWNVQIPSNVQSGVDYVAQATVKCMRKTNASHLPFTAVVMGASDENRGLFGIIFDFFAKLFSQNQTQNEKPVSTPGPQDETVTVFGEDKLQLDSFKPATVTERSCRTVKFRF